MHYKRKRLYLQQLKITENEKIYFIHTYHIYFL